MQEILQTLTVILREVFDNDALVATPELSAPQVDGWDSLAHIRLMLSVERRLGVKFSASEIGKLKNVGELAQLIQSKKG